MLYNFCEAADIQGRISSWEGILEVKIHWEQRQRPVNSSQSDSSLCHKLYDQRKPKKASQALLSPIYRYGYLAL